MENLTIHESPKLREPILIMAFGGWPDAGEGATQAVKHLVRKLKATKFAEIDSEEFYDFTQTRPNTFLTADGMRWTQWPTNRFYYWQNPEGEQDLLFFAGIEPNLRWRTYTRLVMEVIGEADCRSVLHLGALLDAVPHTRDTQLTGTSDDPEWKKALEGMDTTGSSYEGPTGITSAITESCNEKDIFYTSVWGHAPHYLNATPNYKVSHALLTVVDRLLHVPLYLEDMQQNVSDFEREVESAIAEDSQIQSYVKRLEEHYDNIFSQPKGSGDILSSEEVLSDLDEFLKREQKRKNRGKGPGENDSPEG